MQENILSELECYGSMKESITLLFLVFMALSMPKFKESIKVKVKVMII